MSHFKWVILISLLFLPLGCSSEPAPSTDVSNVQMIFWEIQSWEVGGGSSRLTIWADGRSEIMVVPDVNVERLPGKFCLREGWGLIQDQERIHFLRTKPFPEQIAKHKFNQALEAGIHLLETFKPNYVDGSGTLVGVQIDDEIKETVIPMFSDQQRGSVNHQRFVAVARVLADFDKQAYDIQD